MLQIKFAYGCCNAFCNRSPRYAHRSLFSTFYLQCLNALGNPGLVEVIHRICGGPRAAPPPPELAVSSGWGGASRSPTVLDCYLLQSERTIRETSISPGIFATPPPIQHPCALQWSAPVTHFRWQYKSLTRARSNQKYVLIIAF